MTAPVLLVVAHPALHRSRMNRALIDAVAGMEGVRLHDLYETYPDYLIDVPREQDLLAGARALVLQHPLYWYSAPGLVKEWFDLVLTYGFAYGAEGRALRDKPWLTAITTGGLAGAYGAEGVNRFSIEELLRPIEATAGLCGARWQDPFVTHGGRILDGDAVGAAAGAYRARIAALIAETAP